MHEASWSHQHTLTAKRRRLRVLERDDAHSGQKGRRRTPPVGVWRYRWSGPAMLVPWELELLWAHNLHDSPPPSWSCTEDKVLQRKYSATIVESVMHSFP